MARKVFVAGVGMVPFAKPGASGTYDVMGAIAARQALEDAGGWAQRDTAARFAEYVSTVVRALGDRVNHWVVLNEPKTFSSVGYWYGTHDMLIPRPKAQPFGLAVGLQRSVRIAAVQRGIQKPEVLEAVPTFGGGHILR